MKAALPMVAVLAFSANQAVAQSPIFTASQRAEGEAQIRTAAKLLTDKIRNPASARFRNVFLQKTIGVDQQEHVMFCGEINAQNGYGGMSGFHQFMLVGDTVYIGGRDEILNADEICANGRGVIDKRDYTPELRKVFDANAGG